MIQEIKYGGLSTTPSDYECPDGPLALSLNLIHEDDQLKPVFQSGAKYTESVAEGFTILCIHKTATFSHYILCKTTDDGKFNIYYANDPTTITSDSTPIATITGTVTGATCVGNTVCVLSSSGVHYFLWASNTTSGGSLYKYLGNHLPETRLSFGLQCEFYREGTFDITCDSDGFSEGTGKFTSDGISTITEQVMAKINKLVNEQVVQKGHFCFPFFIRYAYRLFDGSLTMHSAPILMIPRSSGGPEVYWTHQYWPEDEDDGMWRWTCYIDSPICDIDMALVKDNGLEKWKDIISSVDIFISSPIYTYDQSGKVGDHFRNGDNSFGFYGLNLGTMDAAYTSAMKKKLNRHGLFNTCDAALASGMYDDLDTGSSHNIKYPSFIPPEKSEESINEEISNCSSFYLLKSIPLDDVIEMGSATSRTVIDINDNYLSSLVNREAMTDDYDSHDTIIPNSSFGYNTRLMLYGVSKNLFPGYVEQPFAEGLLYDFSFSACSVSGSTRTCCTNVYDYEKNSSEANKCFKIKSIYTYIRRDGKQYVIKESAKSVKFVDGKRVELDYILNPSPYPSNGNPMLRIPFFYHPDPNAFKVVLAGEIDTSTSEVYTSDKFTLALPLVPHETLTGSFYFKGYEEQDLATNILAFPVETTDNTIHLPNRIYVSEVGNPFFFPVASICSVGSGEVIGVSTATQALSQGQFGSHPLYAFATDGIWALTVGTTGTFSAVQPISRDVCINADSITQIDTAVLFASQRGIMMVSGSEVRCISDAVFGLTAYDVTTLPSFATLLQLAGISSVAGFSSLDMPTFLASCRMAYDYLHQHVIVYNPATDDDGNPIYGFAFVFSLRSAEWGMMTSTLAYNINSYPDALCVTHDRHVVTFDDTDQTVSNGVFITRPIKFGDAGVLKAIHTVIQRGYFQPVTTNSDGDVKTVLYGSRDLNHWFVIASSTSNVIRHLRGTAYKYFRLAGITSFTRSKSLYGATVDLITKATHKLH